MGIIREAKYGEIEIDRDTQPDEPGFLLRGQDRLAPELIDIYARLVRAAAHGAEAAADSGGAVRLHDLAAQAVTQANAMRLWQTSHPVRLPD